MTKQEHDAICLAIQQLATVLTEPDVYELSVNVHVWAICDELNKSMPFPHSIDVEDAA